MTRFVVRAGGTNDAVCLARLGQSDSDAWTKAQLTQEFDVAVSKVRVVETQPMDTGPDAKPSIVGGIIRWAVHDTLEVLYVVVHPAMRRRGLGQMLMQTVLDEARATQKSAVMLEVRQTNTAAVALYARLGFVQTGRRANYYAGSGETALLMTLTL